MPSQNEIRERITKTIVESLKSGGLPPWRRPWAADPNAGFPANVVSKKKYRGINPLLLADRRHAARPQGQVVGHLQSVERTGRPGHEAARQRAFGRMGHSDHILKPLKITEEKEDGDEEKTIFMMRGYTVFNIDQVEGEHLDHLRVGHTVINANPVDTDEEADRVIAATRPTSAMAATKPSTTGRRTSSKSRYVTSSRLPNTTRRSCTSFVHWSEPEPPGLESQGRRLRHGRTDRRNGILLPGVANSASPTPRRCRIMPATCRVGSRPWRTTRSSSSKQQSQASKAADFILSFSRVEEPEEVAV